VAEHSPAREAAARAAVELVEQGMTLGLGSGRALWRVVELLGQRWPGPPPLRAAVASEGTGERARAAGIEVVELDGEIELDLALDGAHQVDAQLRLIKGGGGALLREKIVVAAARRFVVVAETSKRVDRLGDGYDLPVEVTRFAWPDTARRLGAVLPGGALRRDGEPPYVTDEGHHIIDCPIAPGVDLDGLGARLRCVPGVLEHGLFVGMAERALLGGEDGTVEQLERRP
jgi:ribose 5-phosphate isomerase A